jgi:protein-S-isoprenylcysteine O-methyltransferase Ste14
MFPTGRTSPSEVVQESPDTLEEERRAPLVVVRRGRVGEEVAEAGVAVHVGVDAACDSRLVPGRDRLLRREAVVPGDVEGGPHPGRHLVGQVGAAVQEEHGGRPRSVPPQLGHHPGAHRDAGEHRVVRLPVQGQAGPVPDGVPADVVLQGQPFLERLRRPAVVQVGDAHLVAVPAQRAREVELDPAQPERRVEQDDSHGRTSSLDDGRPGGQGDIREAFYGHPAHDRGVRPAGRDNGHVHASEVVAFRLWPPVATGAPLLVGWLASAVWGDPVTVGGWRFPLGWVLVLAFAGWNGWALWLFHRHRTGLLPGQATRVMIEEGPYRRSRNPLYVGLLALQLGLALLTGTFWGVVLLPAAVLLLTWGAVRPEERFLHERFGAAYDDYTKRVRRWL